MKSPIRQAVILAGGLGTRLKPLTLSTPKPMILIKDKPFLEYIVGDLAKNNIKEIIILIGYRGDQIVSHFQTGKRLGVNIVYSDSGVNAGTGMRLKNALPLLDAKFLLLYGDNYWPLKLDNLVDYLASKKREALVTVYSNRDNYTNNNMYVNAAGIVEQYTKTQKNTNNLNGVDIGFFILQKKHIALLPSSDSSFEEIVLKKLIEDRELAGYTTDHRYYGLSNVQRIKNIESFFTPKKVIFLDRDGVINKKAPEADYVKNWDELVLLPGTIESLFLLKKKGYKIYLITNQAGIARGIITREEVDKIHTKLVALLKTKKIKIDGIYICPHGWDDGCFCRKPNPGMFFQAAADHAFDLYSAYCIGDDRRDMEAAAKAGCKEAFLVGPDNHFYEYSTLSTMIISRTPIRISFVGGGSDISTYYRTSSGAVVTTAINKYIYIIVKEQFDGRIIINYSQTETVRSINDIKNNLVREAMKMVGVTGGIHITSIADIPSEGTGMGSSSSYLVGLLNALYAFQGKYVSAARLAEEACKIEIEILKKPIGKQDQYIAAYGGFQFIEFKTDDTVRMSPIVCLPRINDLLENKLLLFYTGITRSADPILSKQTKAMEKDENREIMSEMVTIARNMRQELQKNNISSFGEMLHENWKYKKRMADGISNEKIDFWYKKARNMGAIGGKLLGAGGGGFLLFFAPHSAHASIIGSLPNLTSVPFKFEPQGSKIIFIGD